MKITIYKRVDGDWGWRLIAKRGGKTVADSAEGYRRRADAVRQINRILEAARADSIVIEEGDANG